jgi:hypothetical protein
MTIDFSALLTTEQKRSLLEERIIQFAAEGYQHTINKATVLAGDPDADVSSFDQAISTLSTAIEAHQAELTNI